MHEDATVFERTCNATENAAGSQIVNGMVIGYIVKLEYYPTLEVRAFIYLAFFPNVRANCDG
jgi:hypothetical protein